MTLNLTINENGVFHPLIGSEVYRLDIQNKKYEKAFFYIVKIENIYVLTNFCKKVNKVETFEDASVELLDSIRLEMVNFEDQIYKKQEWCF